MTDKNMTGVLALIIIVVFKGWVGAGGGGISFMDLDFLPIYFVRYHWICIAQGLCAGSLSFARVR